MPGVEQLTRHPSAAVLARVSALRRPVSRALLLALYLLATVQCVGCYLFLEFPYVDVGRWERGYERLPFQTRLLLAPLYRWADRSSLADYAQQLSRNSYFFPHGVLAHDVLEFALDIGCVLGAGWLALRIYRAASRTHLLAPLVYPLFLVLLVAVYILHTVQNFRYVYDLPSLLFFAAGFAILYFRKPATWFVALFALATLNRETTLLLLPFYALSNAVEGGELRWRKLWRRETLLVVIPLAVYWALWHRIVFATFAENPSEYYSRVSFNLRCFVRLRYWPQLASALGFLGPFLFLGRRYVRDAQLRAWLWVLPLWYGFMFVWGILVETRVFGELLPFVCAYTAVMTEGWLLERMAGFTFVQAPRSPQPLLPSRPGGRRAA
jgi:hypothetical protein